MILINSIVVENEFIYFEFIPYIDVFNKWYKYNLITQYCYRKLNHFIPINSIRQLMHVMNSVVVKSIIASYIYSTYLRKKKKYVL